MAASILSIQPAGGPLTGTVAPPGDKSISHRAAILGGLAVGKTRIDGFLVADDTLATLGAMEALGARVTRDGDEVTIAGGELQAPAGALDLGNSGTGMRLLTGALCGRADLVGQRLVLTGDASLSRRPMQRIVEPLAAMGAAIESRDGHAPLTVEPRCLGGMRHRGDVASAQVKSAILLAGLDASGSTRVTEPGISRDHTERLLPAFGVEVWREDGGVGVDGPVQLAGAAITVPGDLSSAAFMIAAAVLVAGSHVRVGPVGMNPTRDGFLRIVERIAGDCVSRAPVDSDRADAEPVAMLDITAPERLHATRVPADWVPLAIDEFPLVMAMAAVAEGATVISGAAELRVKESDRLAVMSRQLRRLGVRVDEHPDGATVHGGTVHGGDVDAEGDHRIAMSLAVLALVADGPIAITGAEWIQTSYPGFADHLNGLVNRPGAPLTWN